ncbi:MAG: hypothetical protein IJD13_07600 [Oscillospiraceae bacterium]|nr:hypothetical protein [Oscillospiraceae bacterium]
MSVRIFGHVIVSAAYFDRLERVEDELIDSEILRRKQAEDAEEALAVARSVKENWKNRAKELDGKLGEAESELEKALAALKDAEDRLYRAEEELRQWRGMGNTLQEWSNLLTYNGTKQPDIKKME